MAGQKTKFETFLAEELEKERGVYFPVRALLAERLFVKQMKCTSLHPNPDDEFCKPEVGPSYEIVSRYEQTIQMARMRGDKKPIKEPLIVEKVRPDGYMLLNGHHRWAAAIRMGEKKLPVQVINIATENDIRKMLEKSTITGGSRWTWTRWCSSPARTRPPRRRCFGPSTGSSGSACGWASPRCSTF